jgi:hypothetical protein
LDRTDSNPVTKAAISAAAAGLGAAVFGPIGFALGGLLAGALGEPAAHVVKSYAEKFGEEAAKKLLETGRDSLAEKLKAAAPNLASAYRESLRFSLAEIHRRISPQFEDWFSNWDLCLTTDVPLRLEEIDPARTAPKSLDDLFARTMERLDAQGAAIRVKNLSLVEKSRTVPSPLLAELRARLPETFSEKFRILIVQSNYEQAWKQAELVFQNSINSTLVRIDERTQLLPQVAEDLAALRMELANISSHFNQQVLGQAAAKERKSWRDLSDTLFPMLGGNSDKSDSIFTGQLFIGLEKTFGQRPYSQFTGLLRYVEREVHGLTVPVFYVLCHQIEFCECARKNYALLIRSYRDAREEGPEALDQLRRKYQEISDAVNQQWKTSASLTLSTAWQPLQFTVDSARRTMSIISLPFALDPSTYASGIGSTSDMLRYAASFANVEPLANMGDPTWLDENYSLLKLWADFIDNGKIELGRLRINAEDYEEWDYQNPKLDLEIKKSKKHASLETE